MIIGIDITSIPYGTGVGNYTLNLVKNLVKINRQDQFKLFFSSLRLPLPPEIKHLERYPNVKIYHYRLPVTFLEFLWNRLHIIPIETFIGRCHLFHTSDWTQPPTLMAKTVTTIHDLTPFVYPQWHHPRVIAAHRRKMNIAAKKCQGFICVSQNTRNDLLRLFPSISLQRTAVIYEAAEDKYQHFLKLSPSQQEEKKQVIQRLYDLDKYLLVQGTREPRKNLDRLIKAFNLFCQKNPYSKIQLAISGKYGWGKDIDHLANPSIKILGFIPEKHMVALHAAALCLVFPSLYEGFGLPLVKAMKVGTPIITSNSSSLQEIALNAAILINPNSIQDISVAIEKIAKSPRLRQQLSRRSTLRGQDFSWSATATQTNSFYHQI